MTNSVIVLGAKGRFGRAAVEGFHAKGWRVTALARNWRKENKPHHLQCLVASAFDRDGLIAACKGHDVIVNALNPPYEDWEHVLPTITQNVITAGVTSGATVMIPGNVYNYGNELPGHLTEETPHIANTKKGCLRIEMERSYREASDKDLQTIILRSGDFIDGKDTGNWFESYITQKLDKGLVTYPGTLDSIHAWAYLPDMARAMVDLAEKRQTLGRFEEFGFRGYAITGQQLINALEEATGRTLKVKTFPWPLVRVVGLFSKPIREVLEMRYLWNRNHEIDEEKLRAALPDFQPTPLIDMLKSMFRAESVQPASGPTKSHFQSVKT